MVWGSFGVILSVLCSFQIPCRWPTRPGRPAERRSEALIGMVDGWMDAPPNFTSKGSWGRVKEAPTRQIQPADRRRGMGLNLAGRGLSERPQRDLGGNFRWPTRPGRPAERRSEALINWMVDGWWTVDGSQPKIT